MSKPVPQVSASWNQNRTLLLKFTPDESGWQFPKGNKLKLFNLIHYKISQFEKLIPVDEAMDNAMDEDVTQLVQAESQDTLSKAVEMISSVLSEWVENGDLIIK